MANANETYAYNFFRSRGYSDVAARGIVGNLSHESGGLNTNAINRGDGRDGSNSIGIAQWNSTRATGLKSYAASKGLAWNSLDAQLAYVDHELRTSEKATGAALGRATTVREAVGAFLGFERPSGYSATDPTGSLGYADRLGRAVGVQGNTAYTALGGTQGFLQMVSTGGLGGIDNFIRNNPGTTYSTLPNGNYLIKGPDGSTYEALPGAFDDISPDVGVGGGSGTGGASQSGRGSSLKPSKDVPEAIDQQTEFRTQTDTAIAGAEMEQSAGFFSGGLNFASDLFGRAALIVMGLIVLAAGLFWLMQNTDTGQEIKKTVIKASTRGVL